MHSPTTPNEPNPGEPGQGSRSPAIDRVVGALRRLRTTAKVQLLFQRTGVLVAVVLAGALAVGLLDYLLRLPTILRVVLWAAGLVAAVWAARRAIIPAIRFNPPLTQIALRLERTRAGTQAGLPGLLASGLELASSSPDENVSALRRALSRVASDEAAARFTALARPAALLDPTRLRRALGMLAAVGLPIFALSVLAPDLTRIGAARVFVPWTAASWPKRSGVVSATQPIAHAIGTPLPLRALVTRTASRAGEDVAVEYRVLTDGRAGPTRRALLTDQNKQDTFEPAGGARPVAGRLYERLLDTGSLAPGETALHSQVQLEFEFVTSDDRTTPWRVALVQPPEVLSARATVTPPAYALPVLAIESELVRGERDLGSGRDERGVVGPVLAGSGVSLRLELNKAVPTPAPESTPGWIARIIPALQNAGDLTARFDGAVWTIDFRAQQSLRVPLTLTDAYGIASVEEAVFRIEVVEDRPPTAAVVEPASDESVLATAIVGAAAEGRDDVAIAFVSLRAQPAIAPTESAGAPPEARGEPAELARGAPQGESRAGLTLVKAPATIDVSTYELKAGDELWLTAVAADLLAAEAREHKPAVSGTRRLKIISESELVEQVRAELGGLRESAKRLEQDQASLSEKREPSASDPDAASAQAAAQQNIGQRLSPMGDVLSRLSARVQRNRLSDDSLAALLRDAQAAIDAAGEASDQAAERLERLAAGGDQAQQRSVADAAGEAQQQVQEELTRLANLLDRGRDTWAVRRQLERLLTEQRQVRAQTQAAGQASQGQAPERLSQQERDDLERLSRRQREAAQRADAIVDALRSRSEQMREGDPSQAQAMRSAADRAMREQLSGVQRQAADQIAQNQTGQADALQEEAERAIENALDELDKVEAKRDETLRRVLADLIESLKQLIRRQEQELARLGDAMKGTPPAGLDTGMISLNQNTLAVLDSARKEASQAARLLSLIDGAGEAQGAAVASIRLPDLPAADENERTSLTRLRQAVEEAEQLEEQAEERDQARKRAELRKAYAEAFEIQGAILGQTRPFVGKELTRRDRSETRALGEQQSALRERLDQLRSQTEGLSDAVVFEFAHQRFDAAAARAAQGLLEARVAASVGRDQSSALRILQGLVQALTEDKKPDEFREDQGGGGGGGGGGQGGQPQPLVPPVAELKLLRAMQAEAADLTRTLDEAGADLGPDEVASLVRLQADLAERAKQLMEKLTGGPEGPGLDTAPPAQDPDPTSPPKEPGR